jgi:GntR family transcriptional regulator/MocR family aminotransferase
MPRDRREALLALAEARDALIIEDDYEAEMLRWDARVPSLKSLDRSGRVLYVGSLSKVLAPGLGLGHIAAPAPVVRELRALRRLILRHPPANNQRIVSLFFSLGHGEALLRRLAAGLDLRRRTMDAALARHLPKSRWVRTSHGSSVWLELPPGASATAVAAAAAAAGVLVEPGDVFFSASPPPAGFLRLGFSSILAERIDAGLRILARVLHEGAPVPARRRRTGAPMLAQQRSRSGSTPTAPAILS